MLLQLLDQTQPLQSLVMIESTQPSHRKQIDNICLH